MTSRRHALRALALVALAAGAAPPGLAAASARATIARVRASLVAIGTYQATRNPQFRFLGTGFAVADGTLIATSAHVLSIPPPTGDDLESLAAVLPGAEGPRVVARRLEKIAVDAERDVALLRIGGAPLPPLVVRDSAGVAEGDELLFTGFPIGHVLGIFPTTHRTMVSAIVPVAIPPANARQLDPALLRRLKDAAVPVFQLDGIAYPGNSGSPLYDPASGEVVGIVNMGWAKAGKEAVLSQPTGISYAVPSHYLLELLKTVRP